MRSTTTTSLSGDKAKYVEYGLARFVGSETEAVVIDEPLVFLAVTQWMNKNHRTSHDFLTQDISAHNPQEGFNGFENYVAYCLDLIFSKKRRLDEVFEFHGKVPPWATSEAEIVAIQRPGTQGSGKVETGVASFSDSKAPSVTLGVNAPSVPNLLSWLEHDETQPAFCFPHRWMGPDILFILRLSKGGSIWVALQAKYSKRSELANELMSRAVRSVTPSEYFLNRVRVSWLSFSLWNVANIFLE